MRRSIQQAYRSTAAGLIVAAAVFHQSGLQAAPPSDGQEAGQKTSINRELQKLFAESGQQMPSMRMKDLPYTQTPQMDRVRKVETAAPVEIADAPVQKKPGLLKRFFGKFRLGRRKNQTEEPLTPPPIVMEDGRRLETHSQATARSTRNKQHRPAAGSSVVRVTPSGPARQSAVKQPVPMRATVESQAVRTTVRGPRQISPERVVSRLPSVDLTDVPEESDDYFADLFADAEQAVSDQEPLDLEAIGTDSVQAAAQPLMATAEAAAGTVQEVQEALPEESPFTGVTITESDEELFIDSLSDAADTVVVVGDESEAPSADEDWDTIIAGMAEPAADGDAVSEAVDVTEESSEVITAEAGATDDGWYSRSAQTDASATSQFPENSARTSAQVVSQTKLPSTPAQTRQQKIEARSHLQGFLGFCPVRLRNDRELVDGSETWEATFGLQTYQFSTEQARAEFEQNPTRYAPAAGGADVVALVNSGEQHAGSIRYAMWYRDRLYLFHSLETKKLFCEAPAVYADQY